MVDVSPRRRVLQYRLRSVGAITVAGFALVPLTELIPNFEGFVSWIFVTLLVAAGFICFWWIEAQRLDTITLNEKLKLRLQGNEVFLSSSEKLILMLLEWRAKISGPGFAARFAFYGFLGICLVFSLFYGSREVYIRNGFGSESLLLAMMTAGLLGGYAFFLRQIFFTTKIEHEIMEHQKQIATGGRVDVRPR